MKKEDFIEKAKKIHGNRYDYSRVEYINNKTKVCIICPEHGEFWQRPNDHLNRKGCPSCRYISSSIKLKSNTEEFINKAKKIYGNKYNYSKVKYINSQTKVCIICPEHGEFWQRPNNLLNGHGCPICGIKKRSESQVLGKLKFIKKAKKIHGNKYDYSRVEYVNNRTKVCIICPIHGEFWQTPDSHLQRNGCYKCRHSKLEDIIYMFLIDNNIKFEAQKTFQWLRYKKPLRLDFYLPDYNIAIECQGEQHFKPIKHFGGEKRFNENCKRDNVKKSLCEQNKIKIIYISKKNKSNIKNILYDAFQKN